MDNQSQTGNQLGFKLQPINNLLALPLAFLYKSVFPAPAGGARLTTSGLMVPNSNWFSLK